MAYYSRGTLTLDDPDPDGRTEIEVKPIGKGMFSKAYLTKTGTPYVYLITREDDGGDYSKRILSEATPGPGDTWKRSRYLPAVVDVGCLNDGSCVYRMPFYRAPLRKKDSAKAWKQYAALKRCWNDATDNVRAKLAKKYDYQNAAHQYQYRGYEIMCEVVECAQKSKDVPAGLVNALEELVDGSANYGSDYTFEFSPRNLATTESGHLILLDVVFSLESVSKTHAKARKKSRGW
jgi:hypothetical protein